MAAAGAWLAVWGRQPVWVHLVTAAGMLGLLGALAAWTRGLGAGDVKLGAALGLGLGWPAALWAVTLGSLAGGAVAAGALALRRLGPRDALAFGPYLALGGLAALLLAVHAG
ncbi:membrane protein of unknown function [Candidatus Hydrogenisulfobacillus filiaventi]|uniref:Prepilin type IV endopeptidase peptidase domain-containing protein n=1 Tax=Candidatus Hydrogenisulfobacillus filiaventi TaxID=2707344 RepID=A0A6F8ZGU5_9FIRM|nr:membrane protein of unknown function [Candidatus Hydrogenisulfobacillus filiaventi]